MRRSEGAERSLCNPIVLSVHLQSPHADGAAQVVCRIATTDPSIKRNRVHSKDTRVLSTSVQLRQNTSGVNDLATDARLAIQLPSPSRSGTPQPLQPRRPNECEFQPD